MYQVINKSKSAALQLEGGTIESVEIKDNKETLWTKIKRHYKNNAKIYNIGVSVFVVVVSLLVRKKSNLKRK